ncbi:MAG: glycosyltransferase family 2 protein [Litorimonas sp.]
MTGGVPKKASKDSKSYKGQTLASNETISVVMVSYKTGAVLIEAVNAVLQDEDIFELIIVDNGNSKEARAQLAQYVQAHGQVRILQGHGNVGFARGCNYGAKQSLGNYILFLNPDAVLTKGSARKAANGANALNRPWIIGGLLHDIHGKEQRGARRGELTPLSAFTGFTGLSRFAMFKSIHREAEPMPSEAVPMKTISGACLMIDRPSFEKIGGFDEAYFLHVEDIDICRRVRQLGGDVIFSPHMSALHYGSTSKVHRGKVEIEKFKGFIYYFWNYKPGVIPKFLTALAAPFIATALFGRVVLSEIQVVLKTR